MVVFLPQSDIPMTPVTSLEKKKSAIVWSNLFIFIIFHTVGIYGLYAYIFQVKWLTFFFTQLLIFCAGLGMTAGAHRLWSHRSYKAHLPLQILLIIFNTICFQGPVITWVRDHRMHHKYTETNADPHNAKRGFFFAHIGWLLVRKHPDIKAKGHTIYLDDVTTNSVLQFQKRYYALLAFITGFVIPAYIPTFWNETLLNAFVVCAIYRCVFVWHSTYLVNSWAHLWGARPYDKNINPTESKIVSYFAMGEGYHNYHHTFPWDYKAAELGEMFINSTRIFIELMAKIGWAYDLKTVPTQVIQKRVERTGDGSHEMWSWKKALLEDGKEATLVK